MSALNPLLFAFSNENSINVFSEDLGLSFTLLSSSDGLLLQPVSAAKSMHEHANAKNILLFFILISSCKI